MKRVLIVCGAGASSSFLALRMRKAAPELGLTIQVSAGSVDDFENQLRVQDVVLVGPHLGDQFVQLRQTAAAHGVAAGLLPQDVFGADGVDLAFALLDSIVAPAAPH